MKKLRQLQDRAAAILQEQEAMNATASAQGREFTDDEWTRYNALSTEFDVVRASVQRAKDMRERTLSLEDDDDRPASGFGGDGASLIQSRIGAAKYAELFGPPRCDHGWKNTDEFLRTVASGLGDSRIQAAMGTGGSAGLVVPQEYAQRWLDASLEKEIVRPRAAVWPMTTDTLRIPAWDMSSNASTLYGGFDVAWIAEHGTFDESEPKLRSLILTANKLGLYTKASNEVLDDTAGALEMQLGARMVEAIGFAFDYYCLRGIGGAQPIGVINAGSTIEVAKESGQVADTILYINLCKMFARLAPQCVSNSVWVANQTAIPELLQLTIPVGTSGAYIPAMTQADGGFTLLTRPVVFTEKLPTLGDSGDIILIDFTQYNIGMRKDIAIDTSQHVGFATDEMTFRVKMRATGRPSWPEDRTPKTGSTVSWCVKLADR